MWEQNRFFTMFQDRPSRYCAISFQRLPNLLYSSIIIWSSLVVHLQVLILGSSLLTQRQRICFPVFLLSCFEIRTQSFPCFQTNCKTRASSSLFHRDLGLCRHLILRNRWRHWLGLRCQMREEMVFQSQLCYQTRLQRSSSSNCFQGRIVRLVACFFWKQYFQSAVGAIYYDRIYLIKNRWCYFEYRQSAVDLLLLIMDSELSKINRLQALSCPYLHIPSLTPPQHPSCFHQPRKTLPLQTLQILWDNFASHYFPSKQVLSEILSHLRSVLHSSSRDIPADYLKSSRNVSVNHTSHKTTPFPSLSVMQSFCRLFRAEYAAQLSAQQLSWTMGQVIILQQVAEGRERGLQGVKGEKGRGGRQGQRGPAKVVMERIRPIQQHTSREDNVSNEIKALKQKVQRISLRNDRALARLQKKITKYDYISPLLLHKHAVQAYCQLLLKELDARQEAESIAFTQGPYRIGRGTFFNIFYERALKKAPRRISTTQLHNFNRLREASLLTYYVLSFKSRYSIFSFAREAASLIMEDPQQKVDRRVPPGQQKPDQDYMEQLYTCHQCKFLMDASEVFLCGAGETTLENVNKVSRKSCGRTFCSNCLKIYYKTMGLSCPYCQKMCYCSRCQRKHIIAEVKQLLSALQKEEDISPSQTDEYEHKRVRLRKDKPERGEPALRKRRRKASWLPE